MPTATLNREAAAQRFLTTVRAARTAQPLPDVASYYNKREAFVRNCFHWAPGEGPSPYQCEILREMDARKRGAVRGPHGLGKTALASWLILHFALTRDAVGDGDWKVVTTASVWRQLDHYLWPEIHKWARRLRWDLIGRDPFDERRELLQMQLHLSRGQAFAIASDQADLLEGAHADRLLYVLDEAKAIPAATWDAAEGALASGDCSALAISTPGEPQGRFYDIHSKKPGLDDWWTRHVTKDEALAACRMEREWADQRLLQWGADSAVYLNRVLGDFASSESEGVVPLTWVEAANERWKALQESGEWEPFTCCGVDVAREGGDQTVLALRYGNAIRELRRRPRQGTMETTGDVVGVLQAYGGKAVVDVVGIGAGVVDRLRELNVSVDAFNASERTESKDRSGELGFLNKRAAAWWHMRELLDPANGEAIALPADDLLTGDLTAPHHGMTSSGKIQVESKEEIRKRLGRSTDAGDAVVQAFWQETAPVYKFRVCRA